MSECFDVAVIGGGINGCGIAADASMRGLSVVLLEKNDLASKTSSSSSKLIHGGLRYLEYFNFSLVKKALDERQTLLTIAPHLVTPMPFVLPYQPSLRPAWFLRTGLFIYDHLSKRNKLPTCTSINRKEDSAYFSPLSDQLAKGFLFYDCFTDDARLTLVNALQAKAHGALILPHTELIQATTQEGVWRLETRNVSGETQSVQARTIINATGPWVESINTILGVSSQYKLSLVKGSHIVVPRLYPGNHAYLLQNNDKRIVFVIPYFDYSMIGTTEITMKEVPDKITISSDEIDYLIDLTERYFKHHLSRNDIIHTWSGIRPLVSANKEAPRAISRDYVYQFSESPAPSLTIYGGKITTYRQLARDVVDEFNRIFPNLTSSSTYKAPLPGAQMGDMSYQEYLVYSRKHYRWIESRLLTRLLNTYGTRTDMILKDCHSYADFGQDFGHGLHQREVDYLINEEWATNCDDILWRRTKLGLNFSSEEEKRLQDYCASIV